jgi:TolB-like protein/DNA-binding winged helix-turn-helix (wHTH) protein/Tfp pilus assembly protein PilF
MPSAASQYRFGPYQLRTRTRELYKHGIKLKLRPQAFQVLIILLERAPDPVTREELRQKLWSSETFVDFEHGLNTAVKDLRGTLSDSASEPRYIETLPKLGYRIIAPVEKEFAPATERAFIDQTDQQVSLNEANASFGEQQRLAEKQTATSGPELERGGKPKNLLRWSLYTAALLLVASGLAVWRWQGSPARARTGTRVTLAVLPFENLTGDPAQEYLTDGLTEEMISQLGRSDPERLGVIARTSVMHYKDGHEPLDRIGRELGVQYVLEGSVRRDADKVRISAQLIRLKDQTHVWVRQYDRELSSLFALQGEIAQEVADEIHLALGQKPASVVAAAKAPVTDTEAYDLYLRGRYFWNKRNREGFEEAVASFQQSIAKDPNYAPAYAGLADTYVLLSNISTALPAQMMQQARTAALKALQLDERLAEAHTSLALITENYDYDWQTAEKEFRRAIELNPNYATAHQWYAEWLMWQGSFGDALQESDRARQLDPFSLIIAADRGAIFYYSREYDHAIQQSKAVLAIDPHFGRANILYVAYLRKGMFSDALSNFDTDLSHCTSDPWVCGWVAYVDGLAGETEKARTALKELERLDRTRHIRPEPLIAASIGLGHNDDAIHYLERAWSERSSTLTGLRVDPLYDPLRGDPRFQALQRRVGLLN